MKRSRNYVFLYVYDYDSEQLSSLIIKRSYNYVFLMLSEKGHNYAFCMTLNTN